MRVTGLILTYLESVAQCIAYIFARCPRSVLLVLICILPTASILCVTWKVRVIQQITEQSHRKKKVITRSWVIQRAQDIVFTKLNPTAFCFLHGLTCVRDVSHTAFLASCWKKKKRHKSHWCTVGQLKRFCVYVGVPCNAWLPSRKHKKCSYQRYTG